MAKKEKKNINKFTEERIEENTLASQRNWGPWKSWGMSILAGILVLLFGYYFLNRSIPEPSSQPLSAGALIVEHREDGWVMLGVIHIDEERGMVFAPPAGLTEDNESPTETASRETLEETGFTTKNLNFIGKSPAGNRNFSLVSAEIDWETEPLDPRVHDGVGMIWIDPTKLKHLREWRFPEQRTWILNEFQKAVEKKTAATNDAGT